jgi:hypothetical protein
MIEDKRMESGNTNGTTLGIEYIKNLRIKVISRSFPASSAIKSQTVCKMNIKKRITNTEVNVIRKVFKRYLSRIFTPAFLVYIVNVIIGIFTFNKCKLIFRNRLVGFKRINNNCRFSAIFSSFNYIVNVFGLYINP